MNKLSVIIVFCFTIICCNGQLFKKKVFILFENKKNGMLKFIDSSEADSVYYVALDDGIYLHGILFKPKEKGVTVLYSKFIVKETKIKDYRWVRENLNLVAETFWKFPKTYIVEKIGSDSVRITLCRYSTLVE